tara:strand:+ start:187 stop:456 length:270 start_codon:yes stop_codon:yes gene_type:complete
MTSDDLGYLKDYVNELNRWNVRVLKQSELVLEKDYKKIMQKVQDDMEDLAGYYGDTPAWDVGGRYGLLNTVKQELLTWWFEKIRDEEKK